MLNFPDRTNRNKNHWYWHACVDNPLYQNECEPWEPNVAGTRAPSWLNTSVLTCRCRLFSTLSRELSSDGQEKWPFTPSLFVHGETANMLSGCKGSALKPVWVNHTGFKADTSQRWCISFRNKTKPVLRCQI